MEAASAVYPARSAKRTETSLRSPRSATGALDPTVRLSGILPAADRVAGQIGERRVRSPDPLHGQEVMGDRRPQLLDARPSQVPEDVEPPARDDGCAIPICVLVELVLEGLVQDVQEVERTSGGANPYECAVRRACPLGPPDARDLELGGRLGMNARVPERSGDQRLGVLKAPALHARVHGEGADEVRHELDLIANGPHGLDDLPDGPPCLDRLGEDMMDDRTLR